MASIWQRITMAYKAFTDPENYASDVLHFGNTSFYSVAWAYYRNRMFSKRFGDDWTSYLTTRALYKHTRLIYNPVPAIVDFYVDNIWQTARNPEFPSLITPVADDLTENDVLIPAIAQIDQWSNWLADAQKAKRYAAATGNCLIEGIDTGSKITHKIVWAGFVNMDELELDDMGNVKKYCVEYTVKEGEETFVYKKIVDQETFRYFKDDKPFDYDGKGSVVTNPYGFVFAVWLKHTDDGAKTGLPAVTNFDKVDNVNSLASHVDDYIHKAIESPKVISTNGAVLSFDAATEEGDPRYNLKVFKTEQGASVHDLISQLKLGEASPELERQLKSFESDHPELQAHAIIQQNTQLSGAALERLVTPAQNKLDAVSGNYDQQLIKLRQMQIAVGGMRAQSSDWTSKQQELFKLFSLESYKKGDLDFHLKRSLLIEPTAEELEDLEMKKTQRASVVAGLGLSNQTFSELLPDIIDLPENYNAGAEVSQKATDNLNRFPEL